MENSPLENPSPTTTADARMLARREAAAALSRQAAETVARGEKTESFRRQRLVRRRWIIAACCLAAIGCLFVPGSLARWRRERNVRIAEQAFRRGDDAAAVFALRIAAAAGADDARFHRLAADLAARQKSASGLFHRRRVVALDPARSDLLAWADDALAAGSLGDARAAVSRLTELGPDAASRLRAARLAAAAGERTEALAQFRAAAADASALEEAQLGEGLVLVQSLDPGERREGERLLLAAATPPATAERALQGLLAAAARDRSISSLGPARQLLARRDAPLPSRLLAVRLLLESSPMEADAALRLVWEERRERLADAVAIVQFLVEIGRAQEALAWLAEIAPGERLREFPFGAVAATALSRLGRWKEVEELLEPARWGAEEPFRLLALAQATRMFTGQLPANRVRAAIQAADAQSETLLRLFLQAEAWGMADAAMEIGRAALRLPQVQRVVWDKMFLLSSRSDDPDALPRFYESILAVRPQDEAARTNLALLNLLAGKSTRASAQIARESVAREPNNFVACFALALALGRENKAAEGLTELMKVEETNRSDLFMGIRTVLLAWAGRMTEAEEARSSLNSMAALPPVLKSMLRSWPPPKPEATEESRSE